jgi:hemoglobin
MNLSLPTAATAAAATLALALLAGGSFALAGNKAGHDRSLYQRLGGKPAIRAVVDDFVGNVAADKRINKFFAKTDIPRLKRLLVEQICAGSGGPCKYTGRNMKDAHRGMGVASVHFDALVEDLVKSLDKFKVGKREKGELLAVLGPMRKDIVERR